MISVHNLKKSFGNVQVLKGINIEIRKGECVCIIGPSGSGKTTMLKMINRLLEPTDGNIYMDGKRIKDYDERELRLSTGYILQAIALFPNLTVAENIALIPEMKGWSKEQITLKTEELLDKVGLPAAEYANRMPSELSGGEQQRVAIARAVAKNPKILLCDEPTGALDYQTGKQILTLLQEMARKQGTTVIIVTHNASLAPIADRVIRMHDAKIKSVELNPNPQKIEDLEY